MVYKSFRSGTADAKRTGSYRQANRYDENSDQNFNLIEGRERPRRQDDSRSNTRFNPGQVEKRERSPFTFGGANAFTKRTDRSFETREADYEKRLNSCENIKIGETVTFNSEDAPKIFTDFTPNDLSPENAEKFNKLLEAVMRSGQEPIESPTPIQAMAIPLALAGKDILASAKTGSGKTLAYVLPVLYKLLIDPQARALIIAPTREIAQQVEKVLCKVLFNIFPKPNKPSYQTPYQKGRGGAKRTTGERHDSDFIGTALIIGGAPIKLQASRLRSKHVRIIIGTPGRINDLGSQGSQEGGDVMNLLGVNLLVIDEADRMLDMGFSDQLDYIFSKISKERQILMFSATMPRGIQKLATSYLNQPSHIRVDSVNDPASNIKQEILHTSDNNKFKFLLSELKKREGSVLVFVETKRGADELSYMLNKQNEEDEEEDQGNPLVSDAIHGDLPQRKREKAISEFALKKTRILVATDVAARGLDIPHLKHVINYDLPQCFEDYIHRIGRTGRAGAEGSAMSFISPKDGNRGRQILRAVKGDTGPSEMKKYSPRPPAFGTRDRKFGEGFHAKRTKF